MDFKAPFVFTILSVVVLGLIPFGMSQVQTEPSMEIDMIAGQTQNPFRIQDENDVDKFYVDTQGRISMQFNEMTPTTAYFDEFVNEIVYVDLNQAYTETAISGAGVYQYSYTVQEGDLPSGDSLGIFNFDKHILMFSAKSQNIAGAVANCGMRVYLDDVNLVNEVDTSIADGNHWLVTGIDADSGYGFNELGQLDVGTEIGIKYWSPSGVGDCQIKSIYIGSIPRIEVNALTVSLAGHHNLSFDTEIDPTSPFTTGTTVGNTLYCNWRNGTWENTGEQINMVQNSGDYNKSFVRGDYWYCDSDGHNYFDVEAVSDQNLWMDFAGAGQDSLFTDEPNSLRWTSVNWTN